MGRVLVEAGCSGRGAVWCCGGSGASRKAVVVAAPAGCWAALVVGGGRGIADWRRGFARVLWVGVCAGMHLVGVSCGGET